MKIDQMKKNINKIIVGLFIIASLNSCIKQIDKTFTGKTVVEIDPTVLNSSNSVAGYPVISRIPVSGRPALTTDSTLRRLNNRTVQIRINLVGSQSESDRTVGYKIITTSPLTTFSFPATATGQSPSAAAATLNVSSAISGTHYRLVEGLCTIPARSSFGFIDVSILPTSPNPGQARFLGIQLDSSGSVLPNPNFNKIGLIIDQR